MNKISGKELNLLKTLEILKSNRFVSFYHFNNLSKREWDTIKLQLRKIETQDIPSNESEGGDKDKKGRTQVLPLGTVTPRTVTHSNLLLEGTQLVQSNLKKVGSKNKGVTTKRKLKGAEVELLVLKSKALVKALYPFLFYSQRCQGVEQTVHTYPLALLRAKQVAEQNTGDLVHSISTSVGTGDPSHGLPASRLLRSSQLLPKGQGFPSDQQGFPSDQHKQLVASVADRRYGYNDKQVVSNVSDSLLPEKSACIANNQLGFTLNPMPAARINSLINALYLIEGPTLLVGASTIEGFKESGRQLEKEKSLVFVGGVLENQFINHLDLKACLKTFLPTSANLLQTLNYPLMITPLNYYSNKLLFLLQKRQESLKKEEV